MRPCGLPRGPAPLPEGKSRRAIWGRLRASDPSSVRWDLVATRGSPWLASLAGGSLLFFIEVLAGFLFSLARKKEPLPLHWRKERRSCERILALPGALEETKKAKIPNTDAIAAPLTAATQESDGDAKDENPMLYALRSVLAIAEKHARPGKAE